jgi:hypothetical protein
LLLSFLFFLFFLSLVGQLSFLFLLFWGRFFFHRAFFCWDRLGEEPQKLTKNRFRPLFFLGAWVLKPPRPRSSNKKEKKETQAEGEKTKKKETKWGGRSRFRGVI